MVETRQLSLTEIEARVCGLVARHVGLRDAQVHPGLRVIQDLHIDSLDLIELFMAIEDAFDVDLPNDPPATVYKSVFTRDPFRVGDLAELVYLQQGRGRTRPKGPWGKDALAAAPSGAAFTQLGGRVDSSAGAGGSDLGTLSGTLFEALGDNCRGYPAYRRRTDGMVCVRVPGAAVALGGDSGEGAADERPVHRARIDPFLIDREPVSTTAYCRFLNSAGPVDADVPRAWFVPAPGDRRREHLLVRHGAAGWSPAPGAERMPMMLVSWYGANAYALWANRRDWRAWRGDGSGGAAEDGTFLPSEAQWEYAARGPEPRRFPWGDGPPAPGLMRYARHEPGRTYRPEALPLAEVHAELGLSPFGPCHMAGNVWQWCRDWYAPGFYATPEASADNPVNRQPSRVRSERGGSWVGPASLCRSSYRRGRVPSARGRCLGFRCVSDPRELGT